MTNSDDLQSIYNLSASYRLAALQSEVNLVGVPRLLSGAALDSGANALIDLDDPFTSKLYPLNREHDPKWLITLPTNPFLL